MEALKPLVVLGLLGTILYGAYLVVQKGPGQTGPAWPAATQTDIAQGGGVGAVVDREPNGTGAQGQGQGREPKCPRAFRQGNLRQGQSWFLGGPAGHYLRQIVNFRVLKTE